MIDTFKNTLLAGLGAAAVTKEKVDGLLKELVERGKISSQEAKELAESFTEKGKGEFDKLQEELGNFFDMGLKQAHVATQKDLIALEARVAALEAALLATENSES
jgi:polyhydroxyalkanoate synthesis regulator phasin